MLNQFKSSLPKFVGDKNTQKIKRVYKSAKVSINRIGEKKYSFSSSYDFDVKRLFDSKSQIFFGYYDLNPFNTSENLVLCMRASLKNSPSPANEIEVGYFDLQKLEDGFIKVGVSKTWCWQQGCRLRWYPGSNDKIMYNRMMEGEPKSVVQNIYTQKIEKIFEFPFYDIASDGSYGLGLNFSRLQRLRPGYGYSNIPDRTVGKSILENEGIYKVNLDSGKFKVISSLKSISEFQLNSEFAGVNYQNFPHYINHIKINPRGNRFMFFHIYNYSGYKRRIRMITCDLNGENKKLLCDSGHVSHYTWVDDEQLIVYSTEPENGMNYHLYNDKDLKVEVISDRMLKEDGHPSQIANSDCFVSDTYPDKKRNQSLFLYNRKKQKKFEIGKFYSPLKFDGEVRVDLHPRISHSGNKVCIDTSWNGKREMLIMNIEEALRELS